MEAASLALAVIPIIISVAEHYSSAARSFKRFRQCSSEIKRLSIVQQTKFHIEIRSLLSHCVGWEQAELLLQYTDDEKWRDRGLEESFVTQPGDARGAFLELVGLINAELTEMEAKLTIFEELAESTKEGDAPIDSRHWRHRLKGKSRFALSRSQLQDSIGSLKELLDCLCTLRSQIAMDERRRPIFHQSAQARHVMEQFVLVQKASCNLYDALWSSCTKHTEHQAHFSLRSILGPKAQQVEFSVGFRQVLAPASGPNQTVWLTVKSILEPNIESLPLRTDPPALVTVARSLRRVEISSSSAPGSRTRQDQERRVRFQLDPTQSSSSSPPCPVGTSSEPSTDPLPSNLCSHSNFCNHLQNFLDKPVMESECCIGYLGHASDSKHWIYLNGREAKPDQNVDAPSSSLAELLSQHQEGFDEAGGIPQSARLGLSKKLATAVLQFYSTPWLRNSWSSNDVLLQLQSASDISQPEDLGEPFVDVAVRNLAVAQNTGQATTFYPFTPNDFLFGLGVLLLELAFQKPLLSMQQPCDIAISQDERHILFVIAKRMSRLVSTKLGTRYSEMVRKCLACDFGRGDDLSKPPLQEAVYVEVICELTKLEELLRQMDLGP